MNIVTFGPTGQIFKIIPIPRSTHEEAIIRDQNRKIPHPVRNPGKTRKDKVKLNKS